MQHLLTGGCSGPQLTHRAHLPQWAGLRAPQAQRLRRFGFFIL